MMQKKHMQPIEEAAELTKKANSILFITGAGISADSGVPVYRGTGGLYNDSLTEEKISIEEALSISMLHRKPEIPWRHILRIEQTLRNVSPNAAHIAIAELEKTKRVWTFTQNIDGLHKKAGQKNIIEIHGNVHSISCIQCGFKVTQSDLSEIKEVPPLCPHCSSVMRPDVVLFGEMLPTLELKILDRELREGFDLIYSIGTTAVFPYIASPIMEAKKNKTPTIEINPSQTDISSYFTICIRCGAAQAMKEILAKVFHKD